MSYITSNWRLYKQRAFCYAARCLLYNKNLCYIAHPSQPSRWIYSGMARNRRGTIFGLWRCAVGEVTTAETRWMMRWPHCDLEDEVTQQQLRTWPAGQALDNFDIWKLNPSFDRIWNAVHWTMPVELLHCKRGRSWTCQGHWFIIWQEAGVTTVFIKYSLHCIHFLEKLM